MGCEASFCFPKISTPLKQGSMEKKKWKSNDNLVLSFKDLLATTEGFIRCPVCLTGEKGCGKEKVVCR